MHWLIPALVFVFTQSLKDSVRKHSLDRFDNLAVLGLDFIFAFIFTVLWMLIFRVQLEFNYYALAFLGLGFIQGFGSTGKVNAMHVSLSQTTLLSKYNVFLPMLLSIVFLHEYSVLSISSITGFLRILALLIFPITLFLFSKNIRSDIDKQSKTWMYAMLQYLFFAGILVFGNKLFVKEDLIIQAVFFQRLGVMVTVLVFSLLTKAKWTLRKRFLAIGIFDGFFISIANQAYLMSLAAAPLVIVVPLQKMLEVLLTTAAGLFIFHEHKRLTKYSKWGYILSGFGIAMIFVAELLDLL